jgi:2-keto-4-pentenoate hydratase/2-oxohepta-3-ene-1,7-dioic acid hydratase in catechol pathway
MKYCRFEHNGVPQFGSIETVAGREEITRVLASLPGANTAEPAGKRISSIPLEQAVLLAPLEPSKIVCVGRNYREHAAELGHDVPSEPLIFLKPPSSVIGPRQTIIRPRISARVDHEGELGVVIGKKCRRLTADEDVRSYILGYTCVNDVTARDLQKRDGQWTRAKGFDSFCALGPVVADTLDPWRGVQVETRVNGKIKQQGNTRDFIFALDVVIRHIAEVMTLLPGDVIATGTPSGVGPLLAGDLVEVTVEAVGTLLNTVSDESR